jgi:formate/nitrite transporter FocA (FNT family)
MIGATIIILSASHLKHQALEERKHAAKCNAAKHNAESAGKALVRCLHAAVCCNRLVAVGILQISNSSNYLYVGGNTND